MHTLCLPMCSTVGLMARGGGGDITGNVTGQDFTSTSPCTHGQGAYGAPTGAVCGAADGRRSVTNVVLSAATAKNRVGNAHGGPKRRPPQGALSGSTFCNSRCTNDSCNKPHAMMILDTGTQTHTALYINFQIIMYPADSRRSSAVPKPIIPSSIVYQRVSVCSVYESDTVPVCTLVVYRTLLYSTCTSWLVLVELNLLLVVACTALLGSCIR